MDFQQILNELKAKKYQPVYTLTGDEPYFIDVISDYIQKNVLTPDEQEFNLTVLYGRDTDAAMVNDTARRFPMMAPYQVVIVKEAQEMDNFHDLELYIKKPQPQTILVLNYKFKKPDGRKPLTKLLKKNGVYFESQTLYDNQVPGWIQTYVKEKGYHIEAKAAMMLRDFLGQNLGKIANEIEKLIITMKGDDKIITPALIETNIGISKDFNNFELQDALAVRDVFKANLIVDHFAKNPKNNPMPPTLITLYSFFSNLMICYYLQDKTESGIASALRIRPFFAKKYIGAMRQYKAGKVLQVVSYIREYDARSKGIGNVSTSHGELLKELVYKILH